MKVLVIEDSERLRRSLQLGLQRSGFTVEAVADGRDGLDHALLGGHDVVVLDLQLPRLDGLEVLRRLRAQGSAVHVLILSARDQAGQRVEGLRQGADDYLCKPFDFDELVARLRALDRRRHGDKNPVLRVGGLALDRERRTVRHEDAPVALTPREFAILEQLLARRGRVVRKEDLLDQLYSRGAPATTNAVEVFVHQLRRKLQAQGCADLIQTRRGVGYLVE